MDTSEIDDSFLDFFSDPLERKRAEGRPTYDEVIQNIGDEVHEYEYDDDFENTSTDGDVKRSTEESCVQDTSADSIARSLLDGSYGSSESPIALAGSLDQARDASNSDDQLNSGTWRDQVENSSKGLIKSSSRRHGKGVDKKTATLKQVGQKKQTGRSDCYDSSNVERKDRFTSYRSSTFSPPDSDFPGIEESRDGIDTNLTSDTFSEALVKNDRFSNFGPISNLSSSDGQAMSYRKKMSLPQVDKSKRVQLTKRHRDPRRTQPRKEQTRTHAARVSRETGKREASSTGKPARKPPVPIPLKSEALYYNGELTVNVRGDKRGNPNKNKFNVTITVLHKHMRTKPNPYTTRQRAACRRRWRQDDLDWDIVQHRAVLPGFNTATDPEVNRRYLHQFGI